MSRSLQAHRRFAADRLLAAAAALLLAGSLTACGPADTGLQRETARQLQERVLVVSQAAAGNDPAAGLAALDGLDADIAAAVGNGQVSEDRRRTIMTASAAVRADLEAAKTAADAAAADAAAQKQEEAEPAAPEAAKEGSAPGSTPPGDDKENQGKGKNKDDD